MTMQKRFGWGSATALALAIGATGAGCGTGEQTDLGSVQSAVLGDAVPGTNATTFAAAKNNFNLTETQVDGLGPIFNERSCSACHSNGAIGGAGQNVERRYGTLTNGVFNSLAATGGSLRQLFGIGDSTPALGSTASRGLTAIRRPARRSSRAA